MGVVDKSGVLDDVAGRTLDIGCGPQKVNRDHVGVDELDFPGVDLVGDIDEVLEAIPDGVLGGARSAHFFEHIEDVPALLGKLARKLRPGAELEIIVPHFSNPYYYSDPTHRTTFGLYSFSYLASDDHHRRQVPAYVRSEAFRLESVRLRFKSPRPFYVRYSLKRVVEAAVNATRWTREFYEENLCYLFPCYEVRAVLVRVPDPVAGGGTDSPGSNQASAVVIRQRFATLRHLAASPSDRAAARRGRASVRQAPSLRRPDSARVGRGIRLDRGTALSVGGLGVAARQRLRQAIAAVNHQSKRGHTAVSPLPSHSLSESFGGSEGDRR